MAKIDNIKLLAMNDDGTPANANIGALVFDESLEYYYDIDGDLAYAISGDVADKIAENVGYENTYIFTYDWRLDPIANAATFADYIENKH